MLILVLSLLQPPVPAAAIEHAEIACVVAGQFPSIEAKTARPDQLARARTYFHADLDPRWYYVEMKHDKGVLRGVLPKPLESVKRIHYYIEITDRAAGQSRTADYAPDVVPDAGACSRKGLVAAAAVATKVAVAAPAGAATVPAGFASTGVAVAGGGIGTTGAVVGAVAVVGGAAAAVAAKGGGDSGDDTTSGPGPSPSPSPGQNPTFTFSGTVYGDPCCPPGPVDPNLRANSRRIAGAAVSNSRNSATATTDGQGVFHLVSQSPCPAQGEAYTLSITAAGCDPLNMTRAWGCSADAVLNAINLACR